MPGREALPGWSSGEGIAFNHCANPSAAHSIETSTREDIPYFRCARRCLPGCLQQTAAAAATTATRNAAANSRAQTGADASPCQGRDGGGHQAVPRPRQGGLPVQHGVSGDLRGASQVRPGFADDNRLASECRAASGDHAQCFSSVAHSSSDAFRAPRASSAYSFTESS